MFKKSCAEVKADKPAKLKIYFVDSEQNEPYGPEKAEKTAQIPWESFLETGKLFGESDQTCYFTIFRH